MAWDGQYFSITSKAGGNLNTEGHVGTAIDISTGNTASTAITAGGILLPHSKPKTGEPVSIGYMGCMKFRAGAPVAANAFVTVTTSGYFITKTASGGWAVGKCIEAAASGGIGVGIFDFTRPAYDAASN